MPVGPILVNSLRWGVLSNISFADLFEDNAPHGRPSVYFLAAVIQYVFITGERPPQFSLLPTIDVVLSSIVDSYEELLDFIVMEVETFKP